MKLTGFKSSREAVNYLGRHLRIHTMSGFTHVTDRCYTSKVELDNHHSYMLLLRENKGLFDVIAASPRGINWHMITEINAHKIMRATSGLSIDKICEQYTQLIKEGTKMNDKTAVARPTFKDVAVENEPTITVDELFKDECIRLAIQLRPRHFSVQDSDVSTIGIIEIHYSISSMYTHIIEDVKVIKQIINRNVGAIKSTEEILTALTALEVEGL